MKNNKVSKTYTISSNESKNKDITIATTNNPLKSNKEILQKALNLHAKGQTSEAEKLYITLINRKSYNVM